MSPKTMKVTGWKAIPLIIVVVGFGVFRFVSARQSLDTQGREALEQWIVAELIRPLLADSTTSLAERGEAVLGASQVKIRDLSARGPLDDLVVRVELEPNEALPPGTELVRYYRMSHSLTTGWRHRGGHASALSYYMALF
jgi:hypothetical protein